MPNSDAHSPPYIVKYNYSYHLSNFSIIKSLYLFPHSYQPTPLRVSISTLN